LPSHASRLVYSPLELVFTDLWGLAHLTSRAGLNHVSFIDAYSRHTWIFPTKSKVERLIIFQTFKPMVEL